MICEFNCIYTTFKKSYFTYPTIIKSFTGCIINLKKNYTYYRVTGSTIFIQNPFQYGTHLIQSMNKFSSLCCVTSTVWLALQLTDLFLQQMTTRANDVCKSFKHIWKRYTTHWTTHFALLCTFSRHTIKQFTYQKVLCKIFPTLYLFNFKT